MTKEQALQKLGAHLLEEAEQAKAWYDTKGMKVVKAPAMSHGQAIQIIKYWEWLQKC